MQLLKHLGDEMMDGGVLNNKKIRGQKKYRVRLPKKIRGWDSTIDLNLWCLSFDSPFVVTRVHSSAIGFSLWCCAHV